MALIGQAVSEEKTFEIVDGQMDVQRTPDNDDGPWVSYNSPVKLLEDPKQIATQIPFAFLAILYLYYQHTKSTTKSENMKFDFFHCLGFEGILPRPIYVLYGKWVLILFQM